MDMERFLNSDIMQYIKSFIVMDNAQLDGVLYSGKLLGCDSLSIGNEVGKLFGILIRIMQAQKILEFGTCLGYSTICIGEALRSTGGNLTSVEYNKQYYEETIKNVSEAGLSSIVKVINGDAKEFLDKSEGPFDMIFQDSDKLLYPVMLERSIQLTRLNGLLIADDTLFKAMGVPDAISDPLHVYNEMVFADKRLYTTILPIGAGVTISVKISE